MKLSSSACLLACLSVFALVVHVKAGFCDGKWGSYCRIKDGRAVTTNCECELKKKKKKDGSTSYKSDCDKTGDDICTNGCKNSRNCYKDHELCATRGLNDVSLKVGDATYTLIKSCPAVVASTYRTWKHREENTDATEQDFLRTMVNANKEFTKDVLLPKFYTNLAKGQDTIKAAWDANCKADVEMMNCYRFFPKCVNKRGDNLDCTAHCTKVMTCVSSVEAACLAANVDDATVCLKYSSFGPYGGSINCYDVCAKYQSDYISAGSTMTTFMTIAFAMAITFIM